MPNKQSPQWRTWIRGWVCLFSLLLGSAPALLPAQEDALALINPGFEAGIEGWTVSGTSSPENVQVTEEAAMAGSKGLKLQDTDGDHAYRVSSSPVAIEPGGDYQVNFQGNSEQNGGGIGVAMVFYDAANSELNPITVPKVWPACLVKDKSYFSIRAIAPEGAKSLRIVITSFSAPGGEAIVDDFVLIRHH